MSKELEAQVWKYDLQAFTRGVRAVVKSRGLQPGRKSLDQVPPAVVLTCILAALCDSASDDGTGCFASEEYTIWKTGISRTVYYGAMAILEGPGVIERKMMADGRVEKIIHLEILPLKTPWQRPHRGGYRGRRVESKGPDSGSKGPDSGLKGSLIRTKTLPGRLPEVAPISEPAPADLRAEPTYGSSSDPTQDPPLSGRILDKSQLWLMVRQNLKRDFTTAQWESWIQPLRLYQHEDSGEYILSGFSTAQVDMARRSLTLHRYRIGQLVDRPVELRVMSQRELERWAGGWDSGGTGQLVYPSVVEVGT